MATFLDKVTEKLKGDQAAAKASKITRKAQSAFKGQIAALEAKMVDDQANVESGQENLDNAIFTSSEITNNTDYCRRIVDAQGSLDSYKSTLKNTEESLAYFKGLLAENFPQA